MRLKSVIDFDNVAAAQAAVIDWQDFDKIVIGTEANKSWYDFEPTTVLSVDGVNVIAVTSGFLIKLSVGFDVLSASIVTTNSTVSSLSSSVSSKIGGNTSAIASLSTSTSTGINFVRSSVSSLSTSASTAILATRSSVASLSTSVATVFAREVSVFVALDTAVTLDNIKIEARLTGGQGFRLATVAGTMLYNISAITTYAADAVFGSNRAGLTMTTTMTHPFGWAGQSDADSMWGHIHDRATGRFYEFNVMTNTAPTLSFVRIKRVL